MRAQLARIPRVRPRPATLPGPDGRPITVWRLSAVADAPIIRRQVDGRPMYRLPARSMMPAGFEPLDITESPIITRRIDPTP